MCLLRIILLLRFATCLVQTPVPSAYYTPAIMSGDSADEANNAARASNYIIKDRLGAEPLSALSKYYNILRT